MYIIIILCTIMGISGAWLICTHGFKLGIVDVPNDRSSHDRIVPKGGGIGILAAFVFCGLYLNLPLSFWFSGFVLSIVSFLGDKRHIYPKLRLFIHFLCCWIFLVNFVYLNNDNILIYCLVLPLSIFVVGTLNFYNFMDGINGIAGISGVVAFSLLAFFGSYRNVGSEYVMLCNAITFACIGFLPFNFPKAKVFMGDIGSVLLGFSFGSLVVIVSKDLTSFICAAAFLFPFYADELITMVVRIKNGDDLTVPHRRHVYQLLANELGIPHWKVSLCYGLVQFIVGVCAIIVVPCGLVPLIFVLLVFFLLSILFSAIVRMRAKFLINTQVTG